MSERNEIVANSTRCRLKGIVEKKMQTCFIFSIAEIESVFGPSLWGFGLSEDSLTETQRNNRIIWDRVRKSILDKGNAQIRSVFSELDLHELKFLGYHMSCRRVPNGRQ